MSVREIVLDTETTGLDPEGGDRVLEIGAVELLNQASTGRTFHVLINPERNVSEEAVQIHGHTAATLSDKPNFSQVVDAFLSFLGDAPVVIHNADFDIRFLNAELSRVGRPLIDVARVVDTLALARKLHPGQANSLDALCDRYCINRTHRIKHGALLDAEILVEVYCELTGGRQRSLVFDTERSVPREKSPLAITPCRDGRVRAPLIRAEEARAHLEHIALLGENAIWLRFGLAPV